VSLFRKIKHWIRMFFFRREMKKASRKKEVMGLEESRNIGLLYEASGEEIYRMAADLAKELQKSGKKVKALGFIPHKTKPDYLLDQLNFSYFSKKDFKWNLRLRTDTVKEFVTTEFDILIDLSPSDLLLVKHLGGLSKARYKTGKYHPEYVEVFDLMLQVDDDFPMNELIEHTLSYLKMIKKPNTHAQQV